MRPIRLMRFFILLILATTAGTARAAEVAIPFTLAAGDSHRLAVTLTQERYQGTESLMAITASAFVDLAVLGSRGSDLIVAVVPIEEHGTFALDAELTHGVVGHRHECDRDDECSACEGMGEVDAHA